MTCGPYRRGKRVGSTYKEWKFGISLWERWCFRMCIVKQVNKHCLRVDVIKLVYPQTKECVVLQVFVCRVLRMSTSPFSGSWSDEDCRNRLLGSLTEVRSTTILPTRWDTQHRPRVRFSSPSSFPRFHVRLTQTRKHGSFISERTFGVSDLKETVERPVLD